MNDTYTATGILIDGRTVTLNRDIPIPKGKVRVVVKSLEKVSKRPVRDVLSDIHKKQNARGHTPPVREQVDTYLQTERNSWD
ncbi:MAG: hypothetical protein OXN20_02630 [Gemmatimonadota bacterium]|nr:hypothetical protein [Gemmatimonadota bacterium]